MQNKKKNNNPSDTQPQRWPLLLRISPGTLLSATLGWLALAWGMFLAVDILGLVTLGMARPMWLHLFNDRPVEWTQWFLLASAIVAAAYLAAKLQADKRAMASRFFFWLAIGLGLMLIEEAGDIRHTISDYVSVVFGAEIFGLPHRVVSDVPYFAILAIVPVYTLLRYGRYVWEIVQTRFYLISGVMLYAAAAISSGVRHLNDFYIRVGARVDGMLFGDRFPVPGGYTQERAHYMVVDAVIEESVELLAVAMILAAILAFAGDVRSRQESGRSDVRQT